MYKVATSRCPAFPAKAKYWEPVAMLIEGKIFVLLFAVDKTCAWLSLGTKCRASSRSFQHGSRGIYTFNHCFMYHVPRLVEWMCFYQFAVEIQGVEVFRGRKKAKRPTDGLEREIDGKPLGERFERCKGKNLPAAGTYFLFKTFEHPIKVKYH